MPDQDRKPTFIHTLEQDLGDWARCPSCRGIGVTFQADCVCCGREVVVAQVPKAEDITNFVKTLSIKSEVVIPDERSFPQSVITSAFVQENKPAIPVVPADRPRTSDERQTRSHVTTLRSDNHSERGGGSREGTRCASLGQLQQQQQHSDDCTKIFQSSSSSSSRRSCRGAGRGTGRGTGGAHGPYKGVRTRKGVKGFLVEIRPPKWKKTIWLGTYNTLVEAAGAYDAGVFYTNKPNKKYNFDTPPEGAFPPLPAHLRLDRADNMEEIKLFVQNQARMAARRQHGQLRSTTSTLPIPVPSSSANGQPTSSGSCLTGSDSGNNKNNADLPTSCTASHSLEINSSEFQNIPMDLDYLFHEEAVADMVLEYTNYVSQQSRPDQELLSD